MPMQFEDLIKNKAIKHKSQVRRLGKKLEEHGFSPVFLSATNSVEICDVKNGVEVVVEVMDASGMCSLWFCLEGLDMEDTETAIDKILTAINGQPGELRTRSVKGESRT